MTMCANLCHLPKGTKFKAKLLSCIKGCDLHNKGFRVNMFVTGEMLTERNDNPIVAIDYMDSGFTPKKLSLIENKDFSRYWLVFEEVINE